MPGQIAVGDYQVRFSEKTARKGREEGSWGIYLRDYNVRLALFAENSASLRRALTKMFDAAHAAKKSGSGIRGIIARSEAYSPPRHKSGRIKD